MATNTTDPEILGWVQEPDGRGSFGILKSCVITLVLCVYTALHLNIPPANSTKIFLVWRKTKWILIGLFAPEIVVFVAWAQRQRVKKLSGDLAIIFAEQAEKDPSLKRKHEWTTTHSWFAYMGGFAIDTTYGQEDLPCEYIPGSPRITFRGQNQLILARAGLLPDISKESIQDKSKADALAKALVITQASWLVLQCVMRLVNKLPFATLELNTLAHAICALLIYLFWWEKPLDVAEPILLTEEWAPGFASSLLVCSERQEKNCVGYWIDRALAECLRNSCTTAPAPGDISGVRQVSDENTGLPSYSITVIDPHIKRKTTYDLTSREPPQFISLRPIKSGQFVLADILGTTVLWPRPPLVFDELSMYPTYRGPAWNIGLHTLVRWQLLRRFMSDYPDIANHVFEKPYGSSSPDNLFFTDHSIPKAIQPLMGHDTRFAMRYLKLNFPYYRRETAIAVISNWTNPDPDTWDGYTGLQSMTVFFIAALVYGAVHAAAWNGHFASQNEALLWKISCIYVAGYGCLAMALLMAEEGIDSYYDDKDHNEDHIPSKWDLVWEYTIVPLILLTRAGIYIWDSLPRSCQDVARVLFKYLFIISLAPTVIFYLFCRAFLVIEGFIGLRSLPAEAFRTPDWTQYLPHL